MSLLDRPLRDQAAAIASNEVSPDELLAEVYARIEERNPALNAIVAPCPEEARGMAANAPHGPLHGVPLAMKDEAALPWRAPQFGLAPGLAGVPAGESGPYRRLRDAGAVIAGVANMHEMGIGSTGHLSAYGACHNPWDTDRCAGGSSGGSASAVAARLVGGAVGFDGGGSIRLPAAYCGLTGLKPTYGRIPADGTVGVDSTLSISGPMCVDAADCRLMARALLAEDLPAGDASGLRIGRPKGALWDDCQPEVAAACERAVDELAAETGANVTEVEIEHLDLCGIATVMKLSLELNASINPGALAFIGELVSPLIRALLKNQFLMPASLYLRADRVRAAVRRSLARVFDEVDVIAWPTVPAVAPPLADTTVQVPSGSYPADFVNVRSTGMGNLAGIPGINVPVGLNSEGLPIGLQLQATWGREAILLDAAEAFERASDRRHVETAPPLAQPAAS
jgi:Asp-tRNA(Asn)/Glu-tRNA(Gln) amidotransferase A subunit family amidase